MKNCRKLFNEQIKEMKDRYNQYKELIVKIEQLNLPFGEPEGLHVMFHWTNSPLVITIWDRSLEWVHDEILKPIHKTFSCCFLDMVVCGDIQKIFFHAQIDDLPVVIQLINAINCTWVKKTMIDLEDLAYELQCTGEDEEAPK